MSSNPRRIAVNPKARFPLAELTDQHGPASGNALPSTRPVLTGNGKRSPVNSGR